MSALRPSGRVGLTDPPSTTLNSPGSTRVSSMLMQDAVTARSVSVAPGLRAGTLSGKAALFANPFLDGKEEALIVDESGELTYLQRAATDTGWLQAGVTGGGTGVLKAAEVVVVVHPQDLTVWAVYTPGATGLPLALQLVATTKAGVTVCSWEARPGAVLKNTPQEVTGLSHLYVYYGNRTPTITAYDPKTGHVAVITAAVGLTSRFTLNLCAASLAGHGKLDDLAAGRVALTNGATKYAWAPIAYLRFGRNLVRYTASSGTAPVVIATDVAQLVGVYPARGKPDLGCLYLDTAGNLVAENEAQEFPEVTSTTPGLGFVTARSWIDVNEMVHVYGLDAKNTLTVLHQASVLKAGLPAWSRTALVDVPLVPIDPTDPSAVTDPADLIGTAGAAGPGHGRPHLVREPQADAGAPQGEPAADKTVVARMALVPNVAAFALDPFPDYQPNELVKSQGTARPDEQFSFYTQDITSARWSRDKIRLPLKSAGHPHVATHYVSSVTILDRRGTPMRGLTIQVSAETLAEVQIDGASYLVGPGHGVSVATNTLGGITISSPADGLLPATLHVDAVGLKNGAVVQPAAAVHDYLAGTGTLPSQTGLFDAQALEDATVDGRHIVDKDRRGAVAGVVDGTQQLFRMAAGAPLTARRYQGAALAPVLHGFSVGSSSPDLLQGHGSAVYQEFHSPELVEEHLRGIRRLPNYGGVLDDLAAWAGDVWEGIKNGVVKVYDVTVAAVARVFLWIGDKIVELAGFVVDTVTAAVHAVEAVFSKVVEAVKDVVEWLKALFAFDAIWDTKTALQAGAGMMFDFGAAAIARVGNVEHRWFVDQEDAVRTWFKATKKQYEGRPLGDGGNQVPAMTDASGHVVPIADIKGDPRATWMLNQALSPTGGLFGPSRARITVNPDSPIPAAFTSFVTRVEDSGVAARFTAILGDIDAIVATIVDPGDPDLAAKASMTALLDILENLILAALEALDFIVGSVVALVGTVVANLRDVLDAPLELGPLEALYAWVQASAGRTAPYEKMTVGGLVFLVAGFGVTTLAKLLGGVHAAPFPGGLFPLIQPPTGPSVRGTDGVHDGGAGDVGNAGDGGDGEGRRDPDHNAGMKWLQQWSGGCAVFGGIFDAINDVITPMPEAEKGGPDGAITFLALSSTILSATMFGMVSAIPDVIGVEMDGAGGAWKAAFAIEASYACACVAAIGAQWAGVTDTPVLKNVASTILGPVIATLAGGGFAVAAGIASVRDSANPYARAQIAMAAIPGVIQFLRIGLRPGSEESAIRASICASLDLLAMEVSAAMLIAASDTPDPEIVKDQVLKHARVGEEYSVKIQATGGDRVYTHPLNTWEHSFRPLPEGLELKEETGLIEGTPTKAGTYPFKVACWDNYGPPQRSAYVQLTIVVEP